MSEEFGVAGVLHQDSFHLIRESLLVACLLDDVLMLYGCCSFCLWCEFALLYWFRKLNPPSLPTVNLNTLSITEHRLADVDTSSCGSFEVDSDRSDSEGKYFNFFQLNDTFTILHKGSIFIFGTFTA